MKFRYILKSVGTNGSGRYGDTVTEVKADLHSVEDGRVPQASGELVLRMHGNHMAAFDHVAGARDYFDTFELPLPEPKPARKLVDINSLVGALHELFYLDPHNNANNRGNLWDATYGKLRDMAANLPPVAPTLRVVTLSCGHDVWAAEHLKVGDFAPCEQHAASRIVALR